MISGEWSSSASPAGCQAWVLAPGPASPSQCAWWPSFLHLWLGCGLTAQPSSSGHVAWRDAISNSVFLTPLSRGCGFCGELQRVPCLPLSATMTSRKWEGAVQPQTPGGKWETFHFLFYSRLLIRYLISLPFQGAAVCDSWRRSLRVCVKRPEAGCAAMWPFTMQGLLVLQTAPA